MKRKPSIQSPNISGDAERFSKADWIDLYFDLYRQAFGEQSSEQEIFKDAKKRREIVLRYARAWSKKERE